MKKQSDEFKRAHKFHRRLWLWLARNPGKRKEDWPGWGRTYKDEKDRAMVQGMNSANVCYNHCFACLVANCKCGVCPLFGGGDVCAPCAGPGSPYTRWCGSKRPAQFTKHALKLAKMPWIWRTNDSETDIVT